jgi:hypothetical protein
MFLLPNRARSSVSTRLDSLKLLSLLKTLIVKFQRLRMIQLKPIFSQNLSVFRIDILLLRPFKKQPEQRRKSGKLRKPLVKLPVIGTEVLETVELELETATCQGTLVVDGPTT